MKLILVSSFAVSIIPTAIGLAKPGLGLSRCCGGDIEVNNQCQILNPTNYFRHYHDYDHSFNTCCRENDDAPPDEPEHLRNLRQIFAHHFPNADRTGDCVRDIPDVEMVSPEIANDYHVVMKSCFGWNDQAVSLRLGMDDILSRSFIFSCPEINIGTGTGTMLDYKTLTPYIWSADRSGNHPFVGLWCLTFDYKFDQTVTTQSCQVTRGDCRPQGMSYLTWYNPARFVQQIPVKLYLQTIPNNSPDYPFEHLCTGR